MTLDKLQKGQRAVIVGIHAAKALKDRLTSFGLLKGEEIELKTHSLAKQTFGIFAGQTFIAIRDEEAKKIEVNLI
ncbi:MAG: FeoA family protein [Sulfurovaceae bacterium]|nr:FeoA family protein [Sulfurovaceae bacterium]